MPGATARFWQGERITPIKATFEEFIVTLDQVADKTLRRIQVLNKEQDHPIYRWSINAGQVLSQSTREFLDADVQMVEGSPPEIVVDPRVFYKGYTDGWSPIQQGLDVRRALADTVLADVVLMSETEGDVEVKVCLIKGYAGSGKSVFLRTTGLGFSSRLRETVSLHAAIAADLPLRHLERSMD